MERTHASFFSGVGGTDLGLERAGFRTVSFSEIDPYACAVLAERWPGVPNVGDIVHLAARSSVGSAFSDGRHGQSGELDGYRGHWPDATLWSGGFPCQDLSVAGKRAGFAGDRSSLAFAFLALVERYRPPAILLENVPGLLSSHGGRDMARLLGEMVELGYGVAYRVLDAQHFGVPQRRRRVFILGLRSDTNDADGRIAAERAAAVLSVGARCARHPATGHEAGERVAEGTTVGALSIGGHVGIQPNGQDAYTGHIGIFGTPPDANGVREADGLAGRPHDQRQLAFVKAGRAQTVEDDERWKEGDVMPTLNAFDVGDARTTAAIVSPSLRVGPQRIEDGGPGDTVPVIAATLQSNKGGGFRFDADESGNLVAGGSVEDDPLLPLGLDSHRYRCCGNGVVAPVAEWFGLRLAAALA